MILYLVMLKRIFNHIILYNSKMTIIQNILKLLFEISYIYALKNELDNK